MKRVVLNLTEAEAAAILRSEGLHAGHGVRLAIPLQQANLKLIGAVAAAVADADVVAPERGREGKTK